jgi:hypothetical protein
LAARTRSCRSIEWFSSTRLDAIPHEGAVTTMTTSDHAEEKKEKEETKKRKKIIL